MELDNKVGRDEVQCRLTSDAPICESPCCIFRLGYICCGEVFYLEIMQHLFQRMDVPILGVWKSHRTNRMPLSCTLAIITVSHIEKSEAMSSWMKTQSKCCVVCETNTLSAFASWDNFSTSRSLWWMPLWNFCAVLGFQCNATVNTIRDLSKLTIFTILIITITLAIFETIFIITILITKVSGAVKRVRSRGLLESSLGTFG